MNQENKQPGDQGSRDCLGKMQSVFQRQKKEACRERYVPASIREDRLDRLIDILVQNETQICDALMSDFGYRSVDQTRFAEIVTTLKPLKSARRKVREWMRPERRKVGLPFNIAYGRAEVIYQPLGVVGVISPWNFPINLTFSPLAGVFAAGNRAMIKPSEFTPATSELMEQMFKNSFNDDEAFVVSGGAETGQAFSQLALDHLIYTGGEQVAKHIMRAAADNLVPLTLELGGKSPVIVGNSAKLPLSARRIIFGKVFNAGQVCLAPDYVFVPQDRLKAFITEMKLALQETLPEQKGYEDFVSMINRKHAERIKNLVVNASENGAEIYQLGPEFSYDDRVIPVTLIVNPDKNSAITKEEIFGPLLMVKTYQNFDEVIDYINEGAKPLALYYFGQDKSEQARVLKETSSGGVTINDVIMHYTIDDLPFGGVGASGMGAYHGFDGFKQFSHARSVYRQSSFDVGRIIRPPFGPSFEKISSLLKRIS